ncbi:MAG: TRAP transporter TatT component family protein [Candidatus Bipolaricaulia bacterium]
MLNLLRLNQLSGKRQRADYGLQINYSDGKRTEKKILLTSLFIFVLVIVYSTGLAPVGATGEESSTTELKALIEKGDRIAQEARKEVRTEERLRKAIGIYKKVLEMDSDNRHALTRLSLGYFTLAEAYLNNRKEKKAAYREGYKYGLKSLNQNDDFAELYEEEGSKALRKLPKSVDNVEAIFWTGANLGRLGETKGILDSLGDLPALIALNRRVVKLNETYLGGGGHRALGSISGALLSRLPFTIFQVHNNGLSWEKAKNHFERAIELAPGCLENYFSYAKYYALKKGKKEMARKLLTEVITRPLGEEYPLINSIAKEEAKVLLEEKFE